MALLLVVVHSLELDEDFSSVKAFELLEFSFLYECLFVENSILQSLPT
jgi:hypothetical protein